MKAFEVGVEIVDPPADERRRVEDAMAAVNHVVIERQHHQRRVGDNPAKLAGVERLELYRLVSPEAAQGVEHILSCQHAKG